MRILAFDCAGAQCAAALVADGAVVAEDRIRSERGHAQLLMPLLVDLLASGGMGFGDLDRFAVTTGPGSFTGIRVALAAAHGLRLGTGKPVVGVTVFEALATAAAETVLATPRLLVAIESRRLECFVQLFDRDAKPLGAPAMLAPQAVSGWVGAGPVSLVGDAAPRLLAQLSEAVELDERFTAVQPAVLARMAASREAGAPPAPFYLRAPDAIPAAARG